MNERTVKGMLKEKMILDTYDDTTADFSSLAPPSQYKQVESSSVSGLFQRAV